jgi:pimeloyl-ACP methyl ester carboxylesterase
VRVGGTVPRVGEDDDRTTGPATPFDALQVIASQQVALAPGLRHIEIYTMRGLLTLLWHDPPDGAETHPAAMVLCGGAMGGLLGPAEGLYHRLGVEWARRGIAVVRVSYRRPNDLDTCTVDVAATVQLVSGAGAERVVTMGHSFGGAPAIRVAVGLDPLVTGVVTFATQSAGCEPAAGLKGKPLLLFHGERDEILPPEASEVVRMMAGSGEVVRLPGDGHLLAKSGDILWERLEEWLPDVLGVPV